jgi:hypothetical protein
MADTIVFSPIYFLGKAQPANLYLLEPDQFFDGENMHEGWAMLLDIEKRRREIRQLTSAL